MIRLSLKNLLNNTKRQAFLTKFYQLCVDFHAQHIIFDYANQLGLGHIKSLGHLLRAPWTVWRSIIYSLRMLLECSFNPLRKYSLNLQFISPPFPTLFLDFEIGNEMLSAFRGKTFYDEMTLYKHTFLPYLFLRNQNMWSIIVMRCVLGWVFPCCPYLHRQDT